MGHKTSVYLSDELDVLVAASGLSLADLIRRGLNNDREHIDQAIRAAVREALDTGMRQILRQELAGGSIAAED